MEVEPHEDVSWHYGDYQFVFNSQYIDELPPHCSFDHDIDMVKRKDPP